MRTLVSLLDFSPEQERKIVEAAPGWRIVSGKGDTLDRSWLREAEVLCGWSSAVADEVLRPGTKLKWIQAGSAGVDYFPMDELARYGIRLTDARGVHRTCVMETVFALLLALTRNLHESIRNQGKRRWARAAGVYSELRGRTMGIIGAGEIGSETARIAQAFGMRTVGIRRSGKPAPHFDEIYDGAHALDVLAMSDVVVNILPGTDETRHWFNRARLAAMKPSALFLNVGRGMTVDTSALVEALREGRLAGAGLDVFEEEPLPDDHPLWKFDNVIVTPHIGGITASFKERIADLLAENLSAYAKTGKPKLNEVDYRLRY